MTDQARIEETYPEGWLHAQIQLNPETGEIHSDGDHRVRLWLLAELDRASEDVVSAEDRRFKMQEQVDALAVALERIYAQPDNVAAVEEIARDALAGIEAAE